MSCYDIVTWSQFYIKLNLTKIFFIKICLKVCKCYSSLQILEDRPVSELKLMCFFLPGNYLKFYNAKRKCLSRHQNNLKLWWVFSFFGSPSWLLWLSCKHPVMIALFSFWFAVLYFCIFSSVRKHNVNPLLFFELGLYICQQPVFYDS